MAYKRIVNMEIIDVIRRYFDSQKIRHISRQSGMDRKTIRKYINELTKRGITSFDKEKIESILPEIIPSISGRPAKSRQTMDGFKEEISELITKRQDRLKPKSAFEVITERHGLEGQISYSSFKRYIHENIPALNNNETTCRLECQPGEQVQIDYAKMGLLYDPVKKKNRTVYAFIGTLAYSRFKFVEFVHSQNQQSFTQSHVRMFNFFGGVPKVIYLDNLKTGVIKPDLYNPVINKAYAELAEYYECFLNPCRVAEPKDKAIVERDVQTVREEFKKYKAIDNSINIVDANKSILDWSINKYGQRPHGTTGFKPYEEFLQAEKPAFLTLPAVPFKAAFWTQATVHPDHYIQVLKKSYSIPDQYVRKDVMVKVTDKQIYVYYENELIKTHSIPRGYRQTDLNDFPENMQAVINKGMPYALRKNAEEICPEFGDLINKILTPHAFINMRKALGLMNVASKYPADIVAGASRVALDDYRHMSSKIFTSIIEKITEPQIEQTLTISDETFHFVRDIEYFINQTKQ